MIIDWPKEKWEKLRDNFADISCWHMGFSSANTENYIIPPGLRDCEQAIREISNEIRKIK